MHEILFRGKRKSDEQWIYGRLSYNGLGDTMKIIENNFFKEIQIISSTIGQYTMLKDRNGTKIFEGDVIKSISSDCVGNPIICIFTVKDMTDYNAMVYLNCSNELEIIGNIHDNPALLNKINKPQ